MVLCIVNVLSTLNSIAYLPCTLHLWRIYDTAGETSIYQRRKISNIKPYLSLTGRSIVEQIMNLKLFIINYCFLSPKKILVILSVDFKKVYDFVNRDALSASWGI